MSKKNPFSILSDNEKYLLCVPSFFDRAKDYKVKVDKETKNFYILENGKKISKVRGRWVSNVNNPHEYSDGSNYRNQDGTTYGDRIDDEILNDKNEEKDGTIHMQFKTKYWYVFLWQKNKNDVYLDKNHKLTINASERKEFTNLLECIKFQKECELLINQELDIGEIEK